MISVNNVKINYGLFPNNEIKLPPITINDSNKITVKMKFESSIDIVNLIFIKKYLDNKYSQNRKDLLMKYIPYERMDRQTENQMFTCKYFCSLINDLKFDRVYVLDAHSNVSIGILNRIYELPIKSYIEKIIEKDNIDGIFLPDVGAYKKYTEILNNIGIPMFWGNKHRDLNTGIITDYSIIGDIDIKNKNILIVDDICVKGYTTLFASKKLKECGANSVIFYCSHCEDYIHTGELLKTDYVDKIYTTDSLVFDEHKKINILGDDCVEN